MPDYVFPAPNATEVQDLVQLTKYINDSVVGGMFGITLLLIIFSILFISTKRFETPTALAFSSFVTAIISYMFYVIGIVTGEIIIITTIIASLSVLFLYRSGR